ncbi:MAG: hypothetical protein JNL39_22440 [Opitutaceae bacterium]|nr:hypothetical protein [Opitutaceae bacterium]
MRLVAVLLACSAAVLAADEKITPPIGQLTTPGWAYTEVRRFKAPEAGQGVAVDQDHFYAINNHTIGKYMKKTGERVAGWEGGAGGEIIHLNAGFIRDGKLFTIHSNYPGVPMLSSLEIFDPSTLKHIGTHSFGRMDGSFTWLDRAPRTATPAAAGKWIACFVHYGNRAAEPNRDATWTQILALDAEWRRTAGWALPPDLFARFGGRGYSASGGAFGPGGYLYLSGHDNTELYVVDFPKAGSVLKWIATMPFPSEGQAFCWDPHEPGILWSIIKKTKEVIRGRVSIPQRN